MSKYNWKSCTVPANIARLLELLEKDNGRIVILENDYVSSIFHGGYIHQLLTGNGFTMQLLSDISFIDPDESEQMQIQIEELKKEVFELKQNKKDEK